MSNLVSSRKRRAKVLGLGSCSLGNVPVTGYTVTVQPHCRKERRVTGKRKSSSISSSKSVSKRRKVALTSDKPDTKSNKVALTSNKSLKHKREDAVKEPSKKRWKK